MLQRLNLLKRSFPHQLLATPFSTTPSTSPPTTSAEQEKIIAELQIAFRTCYSEQNYTDATELALELDTMTEEFYGLDHPVTASSINNHALLKRATGEYESAVQLFTTAIQSYEKSVGKEHTSTATALHNLGLTYKSMYESDNFTSMETINLQDRAEEALRESMERRNPEHIDRATTMYILASVRNTQGNPEESHILFQDAVALLRDSYAQSKENKTSGMRLATCINNYGFFLKNEEEDYNEALNKYQESYELREKHSGVNDISTIISLQNIAELLTSMEQEKEANIVREEIMKRVESLDK